MSGNKDEARKEYGEMTVEELERELREVFFCTDRIDGPLSEELERIREALEQKRPAEYLFSPEESWARFREDHGEELARLLPSPSREASTGRPADGGSVRHARASVKNARPRPRALLRGFLVAAALVVLLAGAALAADSLGLWAWVPRWNAAAGRYEPLVLEDAREGTVLAALRELEITEPVYPTHLPEGFVITESRVSRDPLVLMEQYAKGDKRLSITITPLKGFETSLYQPGREDPREYRAGKAVHYMFRSEGTITAVWCTDHYAASVSGNLSLNEIKRIIDSVYALPEGGRSA